MPTTVPVGSWIDTNSRKIEEVFGNSIMLLQPSFDPFFEDMIASSIGVEPADRLGRDLKFIRHYTKGLTGVVDGGAARNEFNLYGNTGNVTAGQTLFFQNISQHFPTGLEGPKTRPYEFHQGLRAMNTGLALTLEEMQADATDAVIGEVISPIFEQFCRNVSQTLINSWWTNQNNNYRLCTIPSGGIATVSRNGGTNNVLRVNVGADNGCIDRFFVGQRVDIYSSGDIRRNDTQAAAANQNVATRSNLLVTNVDELTGWVELEFANSAAQDFTSATGFLVGGVPVATDYIVLANQRFPGAGTFATFPGINHFLKFGNGSSTFGTAAYDNFNVILGVDRIGTQTQGAVDVTLYPEHKSFLKTNVGTLTEAKLRAYLKGFHRAKRRHGQSIDCMVCSEGTWLAYQEQKIPMEWLDRTGRLATLNKEGSEGKWTIAVEGKTYTIYESTWIEDGTMYGLKKGGSNFKRLVPPDPKGAKSEGKMDSYASPFRWVVPALTGNGMTKWPIVNSSGALSTAVQMPGMLRMGLTAEQFAGLKLTGVQYRREYSEA